MTYIRASFYTVKFGAFNSAPLWKVSLRFAPFDFPKQLTVILNVYTMSLHRLFTMLLLTRWSPLQNARKHPYEKSACDHFFILLLYSNCNAGVFALRIITGSKLSTALTAATGRATEGELQNGRRNKRMPVIALAMWIATP